MEQTTKHSVLTEMAPSRKSAWHSHEQTTIATESIQPQKSALSGKAHFEMSDSSSARWCSGCVLRHLCVLLYSSIFPVCERATPSKEVIAAPRSLVRALKTALFSSATSAL